MDLPLLRNLQSMKRLEDDPSAEFQTEDIDFATFAPMHPNVIVVDQKVRDRDLASGVKPPDNDFRIGKFTITKDTPRRLEFLTNSLFMAKVLLSHHGSRRNLHHWSIIVKEGLYIDAPFYYPKTTKDWSVEIVGLKDVRVLLTIGPDFIPFHFQSLHLTMRNIRIYDRRGDISPQGSIFCADSARIRLIGVKIDAGITPLFLGANGEGSSAVLEGCVLHGSTSGLVAMNGGEVRVENCQIRETLENCGLCNDASTIAVVKTRFANCAGSLNAMSRGRCVIEDCRFEKDAPTKRKCGALGVHLEGNLDCSRSYFRGYHKVMEVAGSNSKASLRECDVSQCHMLAFVRENGSTTIADNTIDSDILMRVLLNNLGNVKFLRNKLSPSTQRVVEIDKVSKKPSIDVKRLLWMVAANSPTIRRAKDTQRSNFTRQAKERARDLRQPRTLLLSMGDEFLQYKFCEKCAKCEDVESDSEKFRYCKKCRKVCYCSQECQRAHWPDHRLLCHILKKD